VTVAKQILGMHKLMSAIEHLDRQQHRTMKLDDYPACLFMLDFLPPTVSEEFQYDRAAELELPVEAIEYLDGLGNKIEPKRLAKQLENLRERGEHE
jgi:hypothetical protein